MVYPARWAGSAAPLALLPGTAFGASGQGTALARTGNERGLFKRPFEPLVFLRGDRQNRAMAKAERKAEVIDRGELPTLQVAANKRLIPLALAVVIEEKAPCRRLPLRAGIKQETLRALVAGQARE